MRNDARAARGGVHVRVVVLGGETLVREAVLAAQGPSVGGALDDGPPVAAVPPVLPRDAGVGADGDRAETPSDLSRLFRRCLLRRRSS